MGRHCDPAEQCRQVSVVQRRSNLLVTANEIASQIAAMTLLSPASMFEAHEWVKPCDGLRREAAGARQGKSKMRANKART